MKMKTNKNGNESGMKTSDTAINQHKRHFLKNHEKGGGKKEKQIREQNKPIVFQSLHSDGSSFLIPTSRDSSGLTRHVKSLRHPPTSVLSCLPPPLRSEGPALLLFERPDQIAEADVGQEHRVDLLPRPRRRHDAALCVLM